MSYFPNGQTEAYVSIDYTRFHGLAIHLVHRHPDDTTAIGEATEIVFRTITEAEHGTQLPPTLRIPDHIGRALLDALAAHYGGTTEVQTTRKDLLHERGRVDKMIDHLIKRGEA